MDSQVRRFGRLIDIIEQEWMDEKLPDEDITVPQFELPELEPENGNTQETLREQEQKWSDLALSQIQEQGLISTGTTTTTTTSVTTTTTTVAATATTAASN